MFRVVGFEYKEFKVTKVTEKQVVYVNEYGKENREAKFCEWQQWHDTKNECVEAIKNKLKSGIEKHERIIESSNESIFEYKEKLKSYEQD